MRQRRMGTGPVIETTVRIPSGDARHTVFGAIVDGQPATVVEIENDSPVPIAVALAIRPFTLVPDTSRPDAGRSRRRTAGGLRWLNLDDDVIHLDDGHAIVLPRPPSQAGGSVSHDVLDDLLDGRELAWEPATVQPGIDGSVANGVALYPVPHRTSLRLVIASPPSTDRLELPSPVDAPLATAVASGWTTVVDAAARFEFPDSGLSDAVAAARARLLLEAPGLPAALAELSPSAAPQLAALAAGGHDAEVSRCFAAVAAAFPRRLAPGDRASGAAEIVDALALAAELTNTAPDPAVLESVLQIVHVIERSVGRRPWRRTPSSGPKPPVVTAKRGLARLARLAGDREGSVRLLSELGPSDVGTGDWSGRSGASGAGPRRRRVVSEPVNAAALHAQLAEGAVAGSWGDDDPEVAARFVIAARSLLVDDGGNDLILLPGFAPSWRGGNVEVHEIPTTRGVLSYAVRWHGPRPALLWELAPYTPRSGPAVQVVLRCPALDPEWSTTEPGGETLLAGSAEPLPKAPMPGDSFS